MKVETVGFLCRRYLEDLTLSDKWSGLTPESDHRELDWLAAGDSLLVV